MKTKKHLKLPIISMIWKTLKFRSYLPGIVAIVLLSSSLRAQEISFDAAAYEQRKQALMERLLAEHPTANGVAVLQAFKGVPVNQSIIDGWKRRANLEAEFGFDLMQMVQVLYRTNGQYEADVLPLFDLIPFVLERNNFGKRVYWSENHLCLWMSAAYLIEQKYGMVKIPDVREKLLHYLDVKIEHGYYEFMSTIYFPFTLGGLLNLVDFAEDPVIKEKAIRATEVLLSEMLILTNDKGMFYPASARNSIDQYKNLPRTAAYHIIHTILGLGTEPVGPGGTASPMLLTSSFNPKRIVEAWRSNENRIFRSGHTLEEGRVIHSVLPYPESTFFTWSAGGYFHPSMAIESFNVMNEFNLWDHPQFSEFSIFKGFPAALAEVGANLAASLTRSSVLCGADMAIFKNNSVTLSSLQNYNKGRAGHQQWPWAAAVGEIGVHAVAGNAASLTGGGLTGNRQSTLPYIEQKDNLALIMYRANKDLALFGLNRHDVVLFFDEDAFDEVVFDRNWVIGKSGDSYIAILRHCQDRINGQLGCDDQDGQLWAAFAGNSDMYGSFENFKDIVARSTYQERWIFRWQSLEWIYYGMVEIDGKKLEHYWNGNLLSFPQNPSTGVENLTGSEGGFNIFPNPARGQFNLVFTRPIQGTCFIRVHDISGREVFNRQIETFISPSITINTSGWANGMYTVLVETPEGAMSRKLMVQE